MNLASNTDPGMLEQIIKQFAQWQSGYYQFLLEHGRPWQAHALPADIAPGPKRACFETAGRLAVGDPALTYVEGLALNLIPTPHAWVVREDGLVIDPTWDQPENCQYFGWAFRTDYLCNQVGKKGTWGLMPEHLPQDFVENPAAALHPAWHPRKR